MERLSVPNAVAAVMDAVETFAHHACLGVLLVMDHSVRVAARSAVIVIR